MWGIETEIKSDSYNRGIVFSSQKKIRFFHKISTGIGTKQGSTQLITQVVEPDLISIKQNHSRVIAPPYKRTKL